MNISVRIPTKPHINKYLQHRYGQQHQITKKSLFGIILLELLNTKIEKPEVRILPNDFSYGYTVLVPQRYFSTKGFNISANKKKYLAVYLEKLFMEDLQNHVDRTMYSNKSTAMEAIRSFFSFYGITENDIKLESVYRNYQRYCSENIKGKKTQPRNQNIC